MPHDGPLTEAQFHFQNGVFSTRQHVGRKRIVKLAPVTPIQRRRYAIMRLLKAGSLFTSITGHSPYMGQRYQISR